MVGGSGVVMAVEDSAVARVVVKAEVVTAA